MEEVPGFTRSLAAGSVRHWSTLGLFAVCAFVIVHWIVLKDTAMLNANMVPAPALCASQDDMYDTATRLCRLGNKYAFWYLKHKDWVQCAPNLPGFSMLRSGVDDSGNFWYKFQNSREIRNFYDTCIPECATDEVLSMHAFWCASACVRIGQRYQTPASNRTHSTRARTCAWSRTRFSCHFWRAMPVAPVQKIL